MGKELFIKKVYEILAPPFHCREYMSKPVAIITGAAQGIGLALAKACLTDNMAVVLLDVAQAALAEQVKELALLPQAEILGLVCDVTSAEQVKQAAEQIINRFQRVDWLINNAGISGPLAPIWALNTTDIHQVFDVNIFGMIHCIQAFLPFMLEQNHASHVINMASYYGLCSGSQMGAYAMSKHAVIALTESLYFDLQRLQKPIHVSVVCPSITNTQLLVNSKSENTSKLQQRISRLIEQGRPVEETAAHIISAIKNQDFYILPDTEVKQYCEQRAQAVINQTLPYKYDFEKIFDSLLRKYKCK